jgi:hypothetical protein
MSQEEVGRAIPAADRVTFFLLDDGSVVEQFVYARALTDDNQVNVIYTDGRVTDVEFAEEYLGRITAISREDALRRLQGASRGQ